MKRINTLVAVKPPALFRVIQHLIHGIADITSPTQIDPDWSLPASATGPGPDLVIVNTRMFKHNPSAALMRLKKANPKSKLILIRSYEAFSEPIHEGAADAQLWDEGLVQHLPATIQDLFDSRPSNHAVPNEAKEFHK